MSRTCRSLCPWATSGVRGWRAVVTQRVYGSTSIKPMPVLGLAMRPFPVHPRGPRKRKKRRETVLLGCPRSSPEWELGALHALMKPKPHTRAVIEHRSADQPWPADGEERVRAVCERLAERLGVEIEPQFPAAGD